LPSPQRRTGILSIAPNLPATAFVIRPLFVGWATLLTQLPVQLFVTAWASIFFGNLATGLFTSHSAIPFILVGAIPCLGIPALAYFGRKLEYARTLYSFHPDRLEFDYGFISRN
jgi:hypothetical protein